VSEENEGASSRSPIGFREVLEINAMIAEQLFAQRSLKEVLGVRDGELRSLAEAAQRLFVARRYEEAADAFLLVASLDPCEQEHWMRMATSEQLAERYQRAIDGFGMAAWTHPDDPTPHFHLADCYMQEGRWERAVKALTLAIECIGEDPDRERLMEKAKEIRDSLKKRRAVHGDAVSEGDVS
jgi:type III secretion system low calcium response chaperone LcrH/SycD